MPPLLFDRRTLEQAAWNRYLRTCRRASPAHYDEVEAWAWKRLSERLLRLHQREKAA